MKKLPFLVFLLLSTSYPLNLNAEMPRLSSECLEKIKTRNERFNRIIMKDIIRDLELDIDETNYFKVTERELEAAHLIYGGNENDDYYESLHKQFMVASRGKPTLLMGAGEAYFLFKRPDHTNVALHLKLSNSKWEVDDTKENKGTSIRFKLLKCEKDYLQKKTEYYKVD
ncbi:hypothetical protein [Neobacillus mesonae]|uniref:hypothetical protein n=1 Tax=Neobacillus mesonae TaxID=1193713 RepID=UPI00082E6495|nr:hypothetical protein [Neobacillus mesonae]